MYRPLLPREKLVYLAFWKGQDAESAAAHCHMGQDEAARIAEKLAESGLLKKKAGKYRADLGYLAEMIERDNHFYPHRRLGESARAAFVDFLGSRKAASLAYEKFEAARVLSYEGKEVLSGFFWAVFRDYFALAGAYAEAFGNDTKANRSSFAARLEESKPPLFPAQVLENAFRGGFVFSIPAEAAAYLGWSVNQPPQRFLLKDIFRNRTR